jgi:UDP-glucose 4-epimerase
VLELYEAIERAAGRERKPQLAEARLGELQRSVLDVSLAERELGWHAEHSLDDGLAETWRWIEGQG